MAETRKTVLLLAVSATCHETGFSSAEKGALETLYIMLQSIILEIGRSSQLLAEHNGRCEVTPNDVFISLIDMGLNVGSILKYANDHNVIFRIPKPGQEPPQKQPTILHIGQTRPLHSYIPNYFPPFPDAHSYIRTQTQKQPVQEYEVIRDKAASQKRDLEKALTRYMARICEPIPGHTIFANNSNLNKLFPLISFMPSKLPYLDALIPKDQIFDDIEERPNEKLQSA